MRFLGFRCPNCGSDLTELSDRFVCDRGHSFDLSRKGYVNLLLPNHKSSMDPGDNKDMISARRAVMTAGYYDELWQALRDCVCNLPNVRVIVDAGCGEGYFVRRMSDVFNAEILAADISRSAVAYCASKNAAYSTAVCSTADLPVRSDYVDLLLTAFAPVFPEEAARVLKNEGYFVHILPDVEHMRNLKSALYDRVVANVVPDVLSEPFCLIDQRNVDGTFFAEGEVLRSLVAMTPYYYRTDPAAIERVVSGGGIDVEQHFLIRLYSLSK